jgi:hypothetical protein
MISSRDLAKRYAAYLHTQLFGDETEGVDFGLWLDAHWSQDMGLSDDPCSGDRTALDRPQSPITWIEQDEMIVGLLSGRARGCYRVPVRSVPPTIALYLDDADGCSTGSALQERAFTLSREDAELFVPTMAAADWLNHAPTDPTPTLPGPLMPELIPDPAFGETPA